MTVGPHVYGDGRIGCWFTPSTNFSDKLRDRCPKVKALGVTDIFLPPQASAGDKTIVRANDLFVALYEPPPHGRGAIEYAKTGLADVARLDVGALELNIEGVADVALREYVQLVVSEIRKHKPGLRLRINVVPFKGQFLPADLFQSDKQLYVIVQAYLGNMDERVAENEVERDLTDYGIPREKVSVMYGAHVGTPRVPALPIIRYRGSLYQDDLLANAGYLS